MIWKQTIVQLIDGLSCQEDIASVIWVFDNHSLGS